MKWNLGSVSVISFMLIPLSTFARPSPHSQPPGEIRLEDMTGSRESTGPSGTPFSTAQAETTWFGGTVWAADSMRWEAIQGSVWTFDSGVGSSIVGQSTHPAGWVNPFKAAGYHANMEGWLGIDQTYRDTPYFRRLASTDSRWGTPCVGAAAGLGGTYSFWCGVLSEESKALCYASGQGYGNFWNVCIEHSFGYPGGSVSLGFRYVHDVEVDYDYVYVYVDTSGFDDDVEVMAYTGAGQGTANLPLRPGIELPVVPKPITLKFCVVSDVAYSDEDGFAPTACGALAVDDITLTGAITHTATFETGNDGWAPSPPQPGPGGDWANLYDLAYLPEPLSMCSCSLQDSVLAFVDANNQHNQFQDNLAISPWIDLKAAGLVGSPGKVIRYSIYAELPLRNWTLVQSRMQWYPDVCAATGKVVVSPLVDAGWYYFFGGVPTCTPAGGGGERLMDLSQVVPPQAEKVRIAIGVVNWCRWFPDCTGVSNTTPWLDNISLGVYGAPGSPGPFDQAKNLIDNFPQNGTLNLNAPGRVDQYWDEGGSADTLLVRGGLGGCEVYVHFRATPGPGVAMSRFTSWWNRHPASNLEAGFKMARMDTAEWGQYGPTIGLWMACYHEQDPNFSGTDRDIDPTDVAPNGGRWRLANDIFPDDLFTPGSRLDMCFTSNYVGSTAVARLPSSPGRYLDMEIFPSSATSDGQWNCVLVWPYTGWQSAVVETALGSILGYGSANFEGTNWDRFSSTLGRPLHGESGATVTQLLAYKVILQLHNNFLTKANAEALLPWLTLLGFDYNNLYIAGGDAAWGAISTAESNPAGRRLLEDLAGVTVHPSCYASQSAFNAAGCPSSGAPLDLTPCVLLDPVVGSRVARHDRAVDHRARGNGCPQPGSFDVLQRLTPQFGSNAPDERYVGELKSAEFASISTDAATGGILHYRMVIDGVPVYLRTGGGPNCTEADSRAPVEDRLREVLTYFGHASGASLCADRAAGTGFVNTGPEYRTLLAALSPNPLPAGQTGKILFTLQRAGPAQVTVLDVQGRLVRTVFAGSARMGENEATWNGTDESGHRVASGIYVVRLAADGKTQGRKIVVMHSGNE
jgi:flagellar hook capping protein FlgD